VSVSEAQSEIDQSLADQMSQWQGQNVETMDTTAENLATVAASKPTLFGAASDLLLWFALGAVAVFGVVAFAGGSPRRYGR
jgi:hypothetical protein